MKGYTPNLQVTKNVETNSKNKFSFIELGVKQCKEDCDCDKCKNK